MATITNQATLSYNGLTRLSNVTTGELLETLSVNKTAVDDTYRRGDTVTYVINLINSGPAPLTDLTVSDDLGGYTFDADTVYPLTYVDGSAAYFVSGVPQAAPTVNAGPPLTFTGLTVPAGSDASIVYQATVNEFASPVARSSIVNTATVNGTGVAAPVIANDTLAVATAPDLTISKTMNPTVITENGTVTYTFTIQNSGAADAEAADNVAIADTFAPALSNVTVTYNGAPMTAGTDYTYDEATGSFATTPGIITVPAAAFAQDAANGAFTTAPGTATVVVTGTV